MSKTKTFFAGLYVVIIYGIVIYSMSSCSRPQKTSMPEKHATLVVNHSDKDIIIETLHSGNIEKGIYKIIIDDSEYVVINNNGTAIIKHN